MLTAVLAADDRLFAKLGGSAGNPVAVYGLGYDADDDGLFGVNDGTVFNASGIAFTSESDLGLATDAGDYYAEGWYTGFWHYGVASASPYDAGAWADTPLGMAGRTLADGAWDSWTFSPTFNFSSFAVNPQAAPSLFPPGDYDQDGSVSVSDFARWKELYGTNEPAADGNGNGLVDAADYTVWRNQMAVHSAAKTIPPQIAPEATGFSMIALCLLLLLPQRYLTMEMIS
jgi:hypothetical protein